MKKFLCTTALAIISSVGMAAADSPNAIYVFGDSSADLGTFGPDTRPTNQGEMWSERLARTVGLASRQALSITYGADGAPQVRRLGGNNYAINGATALPFDGVFTLKDQVDLFVQDRGRFKADDLVFVWITRNDITTAAAAGVAYDPQAYANAFAREVDRLRALGARNIVAFGAETGLIPRQYALDLGAEPEALDQLRAATLASERALWPLLAARDVFILDIDRVAEDVRANPTRYGFRSTTDSYQGRGDPAPLPSQAYPNDGNVFTGDGHYTSAMQAVVADFALAQLRGREQFASAVAAVDRDFRIAHAEAAESAADGLRAHGESGTDWRLFGGLSADFGRQDSNGRFDPRTEDDGYSVVVGADTRLGEDVVVGAQVAASKREGSFATDLGSLDRESALLTVYAGAALGGGFSVEGAASGGVVTVDEFSRRARLGEVARATARGDTDGTFVGARIGGRYAAQLGAIGVEAGAGLSFERTRFQDFDDAPSVLALSYGVAELESLRADAHATLRYGGPDAVFSPQISVRRQQELNDDPLALEIGPTRATRATWRTDRPGGGGATAVELSAAYRPTPTTRISTALTLDRTDEGDEASSLRVAVSQSY